MVFRNTMINATQTFKYPGGVQNLSRNDYVAVQTWIPDKGKGAFITLPGKTKFRKATSQIKWSAKIDRSSIQNTIGTQNGGPASITSSPGGYGSDILQTSLCPDLTGAVGSFSKLQAAPKYPMAMRNEASTKALNKIADEKAGIGQDLATFRQTLNLITEPGWSYVNLIKRVWAEKDFRPYMRYSARDIRTIARTFMHNTSRFRWFSKATADAYLEYVYGFKPLQADIYGIMDLMKKAGSKDFLLHGAGTSHQQGSTGSGSVDDISNRLRTTVLSGSETAKSNCKIWARIDPNCPGLRSASQLGLVNPFSVAWDLVPWSFVVDWILPIGPVLNALTAPAGLIFVDGSSSIRTSVTGNYTSHRWDLDSSATTNTFADGVFSYEGWSRTALTTWPLPGVWVNNHPFTDNDRGLKALALAISNLRFFR